MINLESSNDLMNHLGELSSRSFNLLTDKYNLANFGVSEKEICEPSNETWATYDHSKLKKLIPVKDGANIIAVDATCRSIAEFPSGLVAAYRGTISWTENGCYRFLRCGPFIFKIGSVADSASEHITFAVNLESLSLEAQMIAIQATIERELQTYACSNSRDSVVLLDGCLATAALERPKEHLGHLLNIARCNHNGVVAISKKSRAYRISNQLQRTLTVARFPCVVELTDIVRPAGVGLRLLGRVFTGKLAADGNLFRIDVDENLEEEQLSCALGRVIGNDIVQRGYPETLRLAHILSVFTSPEVIALQRFASERLGLRSTRGPNLRRQLFGPFGKWNDS